MSPVVHRPDVVREDVDTTRIYGVRFLGHRGKRGISFRAYGSDDHFEFVDRGNGRRWWGPGGICARDRMDETVTPGIARFMESVWRVATRHMSDLFAEAEELEREAYERSRRERKRIAQEGAAARHMGRHLALREWRGTNPTPASERPAALRGISGIKRLSSDQPCRVYFLVHEGEVVYVGQTSAAWPARIESHIYEGSKEFDEVWYLEVDAASLNTVEAHYIRELQPRYNVHHNEPATPSGAPAYLVEVEK